MLTYQNQLTEKEKKELYDLLVKYREAFSLRDPRVDISTTYLHSTPEGQVLQEDEMSVFPTGVIPLMGDLKTVGKLMNGTPCKTLFDSGATSSIISTSFYRRNKILHSYPKYNIPKINVKIANNSIIQFQIRQQLQIQKFQKFQKLFQRNYLDPQTPITAIQYQY